MWRSIAVSFEEWYAGQTGSDYIPTSPVYEPYSPPYSPTSIEVNEEVDGPGYCMCRIEPEIINLISDSSGAVEVTFTPSVVASQHRRVRVTRRERRIRAATAGSAAPRRRSSRLQQQRQREAALQRLQRSLVY